MIVAAVRRAISSRVLVRLLALAWVGGLATAAAGQTDPLPSWNDGPAKQAIVRFVHETTDPASPKLVPAAERIATFDQDGTLWVEQPLYTQVVYCVDRVRELAQRKPELRSAEPFKTVLRDGQAALAKLSAEDLTKILTATLTGMSVDEFRSAVAAWLEGAQHPRWKKPYTELVYQPMLEVMAYLRANGYRTYIVTGGGQDFVRVYADRLYAVPPEQIVGSIAATRYDYDAAGRPVLIKVPTLLLTDDKGGKAEGIYMMIGRRPVAAFGNSTGDREMLEYTGAGDGARLMMLVLHDDARREYAYGPAAGLPDSKIGHFSQALFDEAKTKGWTVISMQRDWRRIFAFE
jgi:phosphoserine phosphatase